MLQIGLTMLPRGASSLSVEEVNQHPQHQKSRCVAWGLHVFNARKFVKVRGFLCGIVQSWESAIVSSVSQFSAVRSRFRIGRDSSLFLASECGDIFYPDPDLNIVEQEFALGSSAPIQFSSGPDLGWKRQYTEHIWTLTVF